jgi:hypothetical protein
MICHYFKIAFRNLLKYKTQSIISIIGLAIGFTCFAFATLWIHYEMTYDKSYKDAERLYLLYTPSVYMSSGFSTQLSYTISEILKQDYPEVEESCAFFYWHGYELKSEEKTKNVTLMEMDSSFISMFQANLLNGNMDFMHDNKQIALTEKTALNLFGTTGVLGKEVKLDDQPKTVCAVLKGLDHSSLNFDVCGFGADFQNYKKIDGYLLFHTVIKLQKGVMPEAFQQKLTNATGPQSARLRDLRLMPLSEYHRSEINVDRDIKFYYLILFSIAGGLVILCSLFNYLSLFITRLRLRSRELGIRKTCGASAIGLWGMLASEYLLMIVSSGLVGFSMIELLLPAFRRISGIEGNIYSESFLYLLGLALLSLLLLIPFIGRYSGKNNNCYQQKPFLIRKCGILLQLFIGILFIFCVSILMKQIYYLTDTDLGWDRKNRASFRLFYPRDNRSAVADKIARMPYVEKVLKERIGLMPATVVMSYGIVDWPDKPDSIRSLDFMVYEGDQELAIFYQLNLLEGDMLEPGDTAQVLLNETAAKILGLRHPVGQQIANADDKGRHILTIKGVLKDYKLAPPTMPTKPSLFIQRQKDRQSLWMPLIKYQNGKWNELKQSVDTLFAREFPDVKYELVKVQEVYDEYLQSEYLLLKLLSFVSIVCILISAFGVFSLVTLSCEQRRKEIAIRKVNGAQIGDILSMFAREYIYILIIASVIAFPIGYVLMKQWLQSYVEQTSIDAWIYLVIFAGIAFIIAICIGWRVWQAARQNPAEVIKNE